MANQATNTQTTTTPATSMAPGALAAAPPPKLAATATGATGKRSQKLAYAGAGTKVTLVPTAATGARQKLHLQALQQVFGNSKAQDAAQVRAALAGVNGVTNPGRVFRQAIRAGILVTA